MEDKRLNELIDRAKPFMLNSRIIENIADALVDLRVWPEQSRRILNDLEAVIVSYEEDGPDEDDVE